MKNTDLEIFEKAYLKTLNQEELLDFKNKLERNEGFKKSYHEFLRTIELLELMKFKDSVDSTVEKFEKNKKIRSVSKVWLLPVAAAITFGIFFLITHKNFNTWEVSENLIPLPDLYSIRETKQPLSKDKLGEALFYYNSKDYMKSVELFQMVENNDTISIYLAVSYIFSGNCNTAIPVLEDVKSPVFNDERNYYLGAAQYCINNTDTASIYWRKLSESSIYRKSLPEHLINE